MSLIYILDGYNIIQSGPDELLSRGTLQAKRQYLLELLVVFLNSGDAGKSVTVVFDGPETVEYFGTNASFSDYRGVRVIFSEGSTADSRIVELISGSRRSGETVVVTNDKGLRRRAAGTGVKFMGVDEFAVKILPKTPRVNPGLSAMAEPDDAQSINEELENIWLKKK